LNVNLYDLLDWFRNPDSATRPERFTSVAALGEYSYVENKVFPLYDAHASRIAKPLLRKIAQFKNRRPYRFPRAVLYTPAADAIKLESDVAKPKEFAKIKAESTDSAKPKVTKSTNKEGSMDHADADKGASLFTPEADPDRLAPLRKRSKREVVSPIALAA